MYVINIEDVNDILRKYKIINNKWVISLELLQYYQMDTQVCIVVLAEISSREKYVIKMLSNNLINVEEEERQAEFSEFLRINGIPVPRKYKLGDKYVSYLALDNLKFNIIVEDYYGENLHYVSANSIEAIAQLLAEMHENSIAYGYHLPFGAIYKAVCSNKVGMDKIWGNSIKHLVTGVTYDNISSVHINAINKIKEMWKLLPIYAVHGDLGLTSNVTIHDKGYGIIDFNLSGDEVLLSDMLITWYSSIYTYDMMLTLSVEDRIANRQLFFDTYIKNRNLTKEEHEYIYDMACAINGIYFNRFVAYLAEKGSDDIVNKMVPYIIDNYYNIDLDFDVQCELLGKLKRLR